MNPYSDEKLAALRDSILTHIAPTSEELQQSYEYGGYQTPRVTLPQATYDQLEKMGVWNVVRSLQGSMDKWDATLGNISPYSVMNRSRLPEPYRSQGLDWDAVQENMPGFGPADIGIGAIFAGPKAENFSQAGGKFSALWDRIPRFEIDDSGAFINLAKMPSVPGGFKKWNTGKLGDVWPHKKLYGSYPELAETPVIADLTLEGVGGLQKNYKNGELSIVVNPTQLSRYASILQLPEDRALRRVLGHEVQHVIQRKEGFATGSSPEHFMKQVNPLIEEHKRLTGLPDYDYAVRSRDKAYAIADKTGANGLDIEAAFNEYPIIQKVKALEEKIKSIDPLEQYRKTSGEFESRNVEDRLDIPGFMRPFVAPYNSEDIPLNELVNILY